MSLIYLLALGLWSLPLASESSRVVELNEKFVEALGRESESRSFLVLFYAPWCHHCRQIEPVWAQVAQHIHNRDHNLFVGRLDCTKHPGVSSHFSVRGFPTIMYINRQKTIEFRGERTLKDILDFALRVSGPSVRTINQCEDIDGLIQTHEVFFADFGQILNENFSKTASKYQSIDWFYYSSLNCNPFSNGIFAIKSNKFHKQYDETESDLEEWVKVQRFPQFVKITNGNFHLLLQTRKYLVIALLDEWKSVDKLNPKHKSFHDMMESIAYSYQNQRDLIFGWSSELTTINSIAIRSIDPLPNLIVLNSTTLEYYLIEDTLSAQNITTFLDQLTQNPSNLTAFGGDMFWHRIQRMAFDAITTLVTMYYGNPVLTILVFGLPSAFLAIIIYTTCFSDILDAKDDDEDVDNDNNDNGSEETDGHEKRD